MVVPKAVILTAKSNLTMLPVKPIRKGLQLPWDDDPDTMLGDR